MTELIKTHALVLRAAPFGETSLILSVFARETGKCAWMAKGARRPVKKGSPLVLEPGYEIEAVYYRKSSRDVQILKEMSLLDAHAGTRGALERMILACAVLEVLQKYLQDGDPHVELYDAACRTLAAIEAAASPRAAQLWNFQRTLLAELGLFAQESVAGLLEQTTASVPLSLESRALLRKVISGDVQLAARLHASPASEREITGWFSAYFYRHLSISGKLRSLDAWEWARTKPGR